MPYPNFGKVRTITLPYETDMTAAQYLARYGIDLATIEMYDLVNIALSDVVYPVLAIDKENKILYMADKAYSYAAGLNEIDSSLIAAVIEEGSIVNAKPIYYHPIYISNDTGKVRLTLAIFNNDPTPFTWDTFKPYIKNLIDTNNAMIQCNGCYIDENNVMHNCYMIYSPNNYELVSYKGTDTYTAVNFETVINPEGTTVDFDDGVNKIN